MSRWTYALIVAGFLAMVAVAAFIANSPTGVGEGAFAALWLLVPLAGVAFLVWFVVTLNRIARNTSEQTRILRHMANTRTDERVPN